MAQDIEFGVGLDVSEAEKEQDKLQKSIDGLNGKTVDVKVNADVSSAKKAVDGIKDKTVKVTVEQKTKSAKPIQGKVANTRQDLIRAAEELYKKTGEKGTEEGARLQQKVSDFIAGLNSARELSQQTIDGLARGFETLIDDANQLSPNALNRLAKDIKKVGAEYQDFVEAVEAETGIEFKVAVNGLDKLDVLNKKIEVISSAKGLDDGIKELESALVHLSAENAEKARASIEKLKDLMTKELNADTISQMNEAFKELGKTTERLSVREVTRFAPALNEAKESMGKLRDSVGVFGATARAEFDASQFSANILSGNVEGLARGMIGLAAGARATGTAIKAALASTVIGAVVAAIGVAVAKTVEWVKRFIDLRHIAGKIRIEGYAKDLDAINESHDRNIKSLDIEQEKVNNSLEIYKNQQQAILETANAYDELAKARDMANANTERDRAAISAQYDAQKRVRESATALNIAQAEMASLQKTQDIENRRIAEMEKNLADNKSMRDKLKGELDRLVQGAEYQGAIVRKDSRGNVTQSFDVDTVQEQLMGDADYGITREEMQAWAVRMGKMAGKGDAGANIDLSTEAGKAAVLAWSRVAETIEAFHFDDYFESGEQAQEAFAAAQEKFKSAEASAYSAEQELVKKREEVAKNVTKKLEEKEKEITAIIDRQTQSYLEPTQSARTALVDFRNEEVLKSREAGYTRRDTYGRDREKLAVMDERRADAERFANAYKKGGVDEYGQKIEMGLDQAQAAQEQYEAAVKLAAAVMKKKSGVKLSEEETKLIDAQKALKVALNKQASGAKLSEKEAKLIAEASTVHEDIAKKGIKAAAVIPGLVNGYQKHIDATRQLTEQMNSLAVTYRDQARSMRLQQEERDWTREDSDWQREFNKSGENVQKEMLEKRWHENNKEVADIEQKLREDADNRDLIAKMQLKRSEGVELTEDELAAEAAAKKAILNDQELEILNRDLNWAHQREQQSKQQLEDMRLNREQEDEARRHNRQVEDEEFERERRMKRSGIYGKAALEKKRLDESQAAYNEADALLEYARNGTKVSLTSAQKAAYEATFAKREGESDEEYEIRKEKDAATIRAGQMLAAARGQGVNLTKLQEAQLVRQRDEMRGRITASRGQLDDLNLQREERRAEFNEGITKQGNRLTAMGLGGDAVGWSKETAANTRELVQLTREQIRVFQNSGRGTADSRRLGYVTWAMK